MKVLNFKSNSVQEKNLVSTNVKLSETIEKKYVPNYLSDDIQIKNFKNIASKIKTDDSIDANTIEQLRKELQNNSFSTEKLADSLIRSIKESEWHRRF